MEKLKIILPEYCLALLIGPSGSGKTHFAKKHFGKFEVLSSDFFRGLVCGNAAIQEATKDAFECLYQVAAKRLARKKLTVLDATSLRQEDRQKALDLAGTYHCPAIAIIFDIPESVCQERNNKRFRRHTPDQIIGKQHLELLETIKNIEKEAFYKTCILHEDQPVWIERKRLPCDRRWLHGPFDIIGDIHGCYDELCDLLTKLGYTVAREKYRATPPKGRAAIFLGDFADRGPQSLSVLRLVMNMKEKGHALFVTGNHDFRLSQFLSGNAVSMKQGFDRTVAELEGVDPAILKKIRDFTAANPDHLVLDDGRLVIAHAGIREDMQGRMSKAIRAFCLFGDVDGSVDELGLPIRKDWAANYGGQAFVVYGHTPKKQPRFLNNTACIDTGCVFGGELTCLRYPEMQITSVKARMQYCPPPRPLA